MTFFCLEFLEKIGATIYENMRRFSHIFVFVSFLVVETANLEWACNKK